MKEFKLSTAVESFESAAREERRLSAHTLRARSGDLKKLIRFFNDDIRQINDESWRRFCAHLHGRLSPKSLQRIYSSIRCFFDFLPREERFACTRSLEFPRPRIEKKLPSILSFDEMETLLRMSTPAEILLEFLYDTGARISEACQAEWSHYDSDRKLLKLYGKRNKSRLVPIPPILLKKLRSRSFSSRYLFPSVTNPAKRLNPRVARKWLRLLALQSEIPKKLYPHLFRHTMATHLLDQGAHLRFIQELLGHASLSTTQKYLSLSKQHLMSVFDQFHPRA